MPTHAYCWRRGQCRILLVALRVVVNKLDADADGGCKSSSRLSACAAITG